MGEAKRRKELGLPPKVSKKKKVSREERLFSWSPLAYQIPNKSISLCSNCDYGLRLDFSNMGFRTKQLTCLTNKKGLT